MELTVESFSSAEENVSRVRYEAAKFRRHARSAQLSGLSIPWISAKLFFFATILSKVAKAVKDHPFELPTEREQLVESLSEIATVRQRLADLIELSEQKKLPDKLLFGSRTHELIKASASALLQVEEAWQLELNNCFPELFSEMDQIIDSIQPRVLPNM